MDSYVSSSTPPPADNTDDDGLPFYSYVPPSTPPPADNADGLPFDTISPIGFAIAPQHDGRGKLEGSRTAILRDLGRLVNQLSYEFFRVHILPRIPNSICLKTILDELVEREVIVDGRWKAFPHDPFEYSCTNSKKRRGSIDAEKRKEKEVFAQLAIIIDAIQECVDEEGLTLTTTEYESKPDSVPVCCFDEKEGRPDAYFVFSQRFLSDRRDGRRLWRDIAATAEFKLLDTQETLKDDVKKLCWSMYQIMLEDPRRRFVFGFTIENTMMRIWMGNRTEVVVSEPFNFITDHEKLVCFFLSMLYGSETDLGLDPTMTIFSACGDEIPRYDITVRHVDKSRDAPVVRKLVYRTTQLISDDGARAFLGNGTRVWEVVPVVNGVEQVDTWHVLKDHWVDDERQHEGEILEQILNEPSLSDKQRKVLRKLFLSELARGDVYIEDEHDGGEKRDGTRTLATRGAKIPTDAGMFSLLVSYGHDSSHAVKPSKVSRLRREDMPRRKETTYGDKHRHRSVFAERCESLSREQSLRRVFSALLHITMSIPFLHRCGPGWVDCDISPGNILLLPGTNVAKLVDLEYAKRLDDRSTHTSTRAGTLNFMAVEVDECTYLFEDGTEEHRDKDASDDSLEWAAEILGDKTPSASSSEADPSDLHELPQSTTRPFFYNPLHDLESIWWIAVYFVINKETGLPTADSVDYADLTEDQRKYARSLFYGSAARGYAIRSSADAIIDHHLRDLPIHLSTIAKELIKLRKILCRRYREIEKPDFVIDKNACNHVYGHFIEAFRKISKSLSRQDIQVAPLKPDPDDDSRKGLRTISLEITASRPPKRRKLDDAPTTPTVSPTKAAKPKKAGAATGIATRSSSRVSRSTTRAGGATGAAARSSSRVTRSTTRAGAATGAAARSSSRVTRSTTKAGAATGAAARSSSRVTRSITKAAAGEEAGTATLAARSSSRVARPTKRVARSTTRASDPEDDDEEIDVGSSSRRGRQSRQRAAVKVDKGKAVARASTSRRRR